ncbi:alpha/beta hydrolase [Polyangium sorediatum]|uniref:Alpha/beta hydrolase n=1 Tax=Polyangium sorediatum TaxID=889274 RepID=A0ABT6P795_9BACT|nr:alpha/beta hydrolase [Polyangium sorediatum]MDI1436040.1 alpha/beta hydrolase [Polyangium sorediatum]
MQQMLRRLGLVASLAAAAAGCGRDEHVLAAIRPLATQKRLALPVEVYTLNIPDDLPGFAVPGPNGAKPKMLFLHGMCSAGVGDVQAFQFTASEHGGILAVRGDTPCNGGGVLRKHSLDLDKLDARIRAAFEVSGGEAKDLVLVGHSQGAYLGERLAEQWPERYSRLILIGAPTEPSAARLRHVRGAVMVSGQYDVTTRMKQAAAELQAAGIPSTYLEMPGAKHGQMGDAERVFGQAFAWLEKNALPRRP